MDALLQYLNSQIHQKSTAMITHANQFIWLYPNGQRDEAVELLWQTQQESVRPILVIIVVAFPACATVVDLQLVGVGGRASTAAF